MPQVEENSCHKIELRNSRESQLKLEILVKTWQQCSRAWKVLWSFLSRLPRERGCRNSSPPRKQSFATLTRIQESNDEKTEPIKSVSRAGGAGGGMAQSKVSISIRACSTLPSELRWKANDPLRTACCSCKANCTTRTQILRKTLLKSVAGKLKEWVWCESEVPSAPRESFRYFTASREAVQSTIVHFLLNFE